jgi:hypothetical protein
MLIIRYKLIEAAILGILGLSNYGIEKFLSVYKGGVVK